MDRSPASHLDQSALVRSWKGRRGAEGVACSFEEKLKPLEQVVESAAAGIEKDKQGLLPSLSPAKDAVAAVVAEGLQRWYSEQPKEKQPGILRRAMEEDNRELLSALYFANAAKDLVHPKVKEAIFATLIERDHPKRSPSWPSGNAASRLGGRPSSVCAS